MPVLENLQKIKSEIPSHVKLVAVTKTLPAEKILEAYNAGHKIFGENRVQELTPKYYDLPKDIEWHLIGHLQTNKVKYITPFVSMIHSVDSIKLLCEINKCAEKINRVIDCLLQIHIAQEETKFGLSFEEAEEILNSKEFSEMKNIRIAGLMGMATLTENENQIRKEFQSLKLFFDKLKTRNSKLETLSMGMSSDYKIAIEEGSNLIRVGSLIFGERK
ncbi:MAG: YggS family pyridoxal phosphate-dependent enzyme [Bacteroidetes bacterium]|nr:YggS family pyridoxal phosphate-dependent enzyme [Bacteroidota bacterium]